MGTCVTAAGPRDMLRLEVVLPTVGAWTASGDLEGGTVIQGTATIGPLVGTVTRSASYSSRTGFVVVGGAGGLGITVRPQSYRSASVALAIRDAADQGGESLGTLSTAIQGWVKNSWVVGQNTVGRALTDIANETSSQWWIDIDGTLQFGARPAATATAARYDLVDHNTSGSVLVLAPHQDEVFDFLVRPPTMVEGKSVHTVFYQLTGESMRIRCHYE